MSQELGYTTCEYRMQLRSATTPPGDLTLQVPTVFVHVLRSIIINPEQTVVFITYSYISGGCTWQENCRNLNI